MERIQSTLTNAQIDPRGVFNFDGNITRGSGASADNPMASFLLGYPASVDRDFVNTRPGVRMTFAGFYAQDDWRVTNSLTLNIGLRWDLFTRPVEAFNRQSNFEPATGLILVALSKNPGSNVDNRFGNWSPRVGFAHSPDNGKTAVRGAFGISYFPDNFGATGGTLERNYPFFTITTLIYPNIYTPFRSVSDDRHAELATVATGFGFTEGPVWDPAGFLYVSDETQNKIYRVHLDGHKEPFIGLGDPDGNTLDLQQRFIDCASVLRAIIAVKPDGTYTTIADRFQGKRFNSPNDVVVGPDGALYFTDPTLDLLKGEKQEIPFQGVYRLGESGRVQLLTKDMSQPNGLAFSPDGKKLYVDDSERKNIRVFDFSAPATLSNERIFGDENEKCGVPDGMKVDQAGNLFVVGPKGIWVWDAQGHHLGTIVTPEQPANLARGDQDYQTLYITAITSVLRIRTKTRGFVPYLKHSR